MTTQLVRQPLGIPSTAALHSVVALCLYSLDLWVAFDFLELIAFLILFQIPYLKSFQINYTSLLFFNSLKAIAAIFSVSTHSYQYI